MLYLLPIYKRANMIERKLLLILGVYLTFHISLQLWFVAAMQQIFHKSHVSSLVFYSRVAFPLPSPLFCARISKNVCLHCLSLWFSLIFYTLLSFTYSLIVWLTFKEQSFAILSTKKIIESEELEQKKLKEREMYYKIQYKVQFNSNYY